MDSKGKVYWAMLESLESFVQWVHYPQTRYVDPTQADKRAFLANRTQIGQLLG